MKIKPAIILALLAIIILCGAVFIKDKYTQIKTETMPEIASETFESYATNIANSLINGTDIEIPDELLTNIMQSKTSEDIVCLVDQDNNFTIVTTQEFSCIGDVDITLAFTILDYTEDQLILTLNDIYLGTYQLPESLKNTAIEKFDFNYDGVYFNDNQMTIEIGNFFVEFLGVTVTVGIQNVSMQDGKMLVSFYSDLDLSNIFS
ncbi:MAG: hypothetical protein R3Y35_04745 [Clostridia bacterium]